MYIVLFFYILLIGCSKIKFTFNPSISSQNPIPLQIHTVHTIGVIPSIMEFILTALAFLLVSSHHCHAMNGEEGTSSRDKSATNYGFLTKLGEWLSLSDTICDTYTILPRSPYQVLLIFGELANIPDKNNVEIIEFLTDEKGDFRWNFDEMVFQNKTIAPNGQQKVTIMLCSTVMAECRTFRVYDTYDEMKTEMATNQGRFYGCFQVMYYDYDVWTPSSAQCQKGVAEEQKAEADIAIGQQRHYATHQKHPVVELLALPSMPTTPEAHSPMSPLTQWDEENAVGKKKEKEEEEQMPLLLGADAGLHKENSGQIYHHSLKHRKGWKNGTRK